jgi:twitching motility protein PilT
MRDLETTSSTITGAETGHLVFSTLHTTNASQTVERIIDIYPAGQQNQIRAMLANTLQAVISQTLFKRIDKPGMIPCVEILLCNSAVRNCIREGRSFELPNIIETSKQIGMQTMDHSIADNYFKGYIDREEAIARSSNPSKMEKTLTEEGRATHQSAVVATASATSSKAAVKEEPAKPEKSGLFGKKK